mmetsp:Transcript_80291/g.227385  ORF Transcript_80291/g.227385 Transcript_80291/m.227385 type:complete len:328 (+) Transcript_80291:108-1091(+)
MLDAQAMIDALTSMDDQTASSVISSVLQARPELAPGIVNMAVPDLTYAPAKALTERRSRGTIKAVAAQSGAFGFISCPELNAVFGNDVSVHSRQLGMFHKGQEVSFAVVLNSHNKPQAFDLQDVSPGGTMAAMTCGGGGMSGSGMSGMGGGMGGMGACMPGMGGCMPGMGGMAAMGAMNPMAAMGMGAMGGMHPMQQMMMQQQQQMMSMMGMGGGGMGGCGSGGGVQKKLGANQPPKKRSRLDESILGEFVGVIKRFNPTSGFGFIACDEVKAMGYDNDVFLHHSHLGNFEVGAQVKFTCYLNTKNQPQCRDLEDASGMAAGLPVGS